MNPSLKNKIKGRHWEIIQITMNESIQIFQKKRKLSS